MCRSIFSQSRNGVGVKNFRLRTSLLHSQAAEEAIPHLYTQQRKRPTLVRRLLSQTQALLGRVTPERRYGRWQNRINAQLALRHILMSGLKMRIFPAQKKKKLDLATENILHNISEQTIFLTVILTGSLHMPS